MGISERELAKMLEGGDAVIVNDAKPAKRRIANPPAATALLQTLNSEHAHQVALFDWADNNVERWPDLSMMYAIPNGGHRHKRTAGKLKAEGVRAGVPDVFIATARGRHHGMYIEMKYGKNSTTENQNDWIERLRAQGYHCVVCYGWEEAAQRIEAYLRGAA